MLYFSSHLHGLQLSIILFKAVFCITPGNMVTVIIKKNLQWCSNHHLTIFTEKYTNTVTESWRLKSEYTVFCLAKDLILSKDWCHHTEECLVWHKTSYIIIIIHHHCWHHWWMSDPVHPILWLSN